MSTLRLVDDVIELNGQPVAKLLPGLKLSLRDELARLFDALDEDYVDELEERVEQLESRSATPAQGEPL